MGQLRNITFNGCTALVGFKLFPEFLGMSHAPCPISGGFTGPGLISCEAMSDIQPYDSIQCPVVIDSYLLFGRH